MLFSTALIPTSGICCHGSGMFAMAPNACLSESPRMTASRRGSTSAPSLQALWTVEQRLARAEQELRIQFTRIAQLQAELDLLLAAGRRSRLEPHAMRLTFGAGPKPASGPRISSE